MHSATDYALPDNAPTRAPLWELLFIALPTIAQMASYTVAQFIDTYMLSHVGDIEATAAAQAGLTSFTAISFGYGVMMLVNALVSQAAGRGDFRECGQIMWQGVWTGLLLGALAIPLALFAEPLFALMNHPPELAKLEAQFFQTTVAFAGVKLCGMAFEQFMLAIQKPTVVLIAAVTGVCCMIPFNYAFIYGEFGMPRLGVLGAAWGLNLATAVEASVVAIFVFATRIRSQYNCLDWRPRLQQMKTLLVMGVPMGVQLVAEVAAWSLFTVWVIAQFNNPALMAANSYTFRYMSVSFMPAFGMSTAVTALVGRYIGMGMPEVAIARALLGFKVAAVYMVVCGLFFFVARFWLMDVFSDDPAVIQAGAILLTMAGVYQFFDAMYIVYSGGLRGAGDTFVPAVVVSSSCWIIVVGGGFLIARFLPGLGVAGPWLAAAGYGVIIGLFLMYRFHRADWLSKYARNEASSLLGGSGYSLAEGFSDEAKSRVASAIPES